MWTFSPPPPAPLTLSPASSPSWWPPQAPWRPRVEEESQKCRHFCSQAGWERGGCPLPWRGLPSPLHPHAWPGPELGREVLSCSPGSGGLTLDWVPLGTLTAKYAWTSRCLGRRGQTEEGTISKEVGAFPHLQGTWIAAPLWRVLGEAELVIIPLADVSPLSANDRRWNADMKREQCPLPPAEVQRLDGCPPKPGPHSSVSCSKCHPSHGPPRPGSSQHSEGLWIPPQQARRPGFPL